MLCATVFGVGFNRIIIKCMKKINRVPVICIDVYFIYTLHYCNGFVRAKRTCYKLLWAIIFEIN